MGEGSKRKQCQLLSSQPAFSTSPPLPKSKLGHSGDDSQVRGFVYIQGPCEPLQQTLLWAWDFSQCRTPKVFISNGFEALFPHARTLGYPRLPPCYASPPAAAFLRVLSTPAAHLLHLPFWINVSSLTSWLTDFIKFEFLIVLVIICFQISCCPSLGCARRQSVSTYASILARSDLELSVDISDCTTLEYY